MFEQKAALEDLGEMIAQSRDLVVHDDRRNSKIYGAVGFAMGGSMGVSKMRDIAAACS